MSQGYIFGAYLSAIIHIGHPRRGANTDKGDYATDKLTNSVRGDSYELTVVVR